MAQTSSLVTRCFSPWGSEPCGQLGGGATLCPQSPAGNARLLGIPRAVPTPSKHKPCVERGRCHPRKSSEGVGLTPATWLHVPITIHLPTRSPSTSIGDWFQALQIPKSRVAQAANMTHAGLVPPHLYKAQEHLQTTHITQDEQEPCNGWCRAVEENGKGKSTLIHETPNNSQPPQAQRHC